MAQKVLNTASGFRRNAGQGLCWKRGSFPVIDLRRNTRRPILHDHRRSDADLILPFSACSSGLLLRPSTFGQRFRFRDERWDVITLENGV